jgi:hypothetical protein
MVNPFASSSISRSDTKTITPQENSSIFMLRFGRLSLSTTYAFTSRRSHTGKSTKRRYSNAGKADDLSPLRLNPPIFLVKL